MRYIPTGPNSASTNQNGFNITRSKIPNKQSFISDVVNRKGANIKSEEKVFDNFIENTNSNINYPLKDSKVQITKISENGGEFGRNISKMKTYINF